VVARSSNLNHNHGDEEMAKAKAKSNKSEKIRAALTANPDKPAAEIAKEAGVTVGLVYNVKANMKKKAGKSKKKKTGPNAGSKPAAKATAPEGVHHALDAAFEFIHKVGGMLHAEQLIAKLKSLKERL
jgi:transposase